MSITAADRERLQRFVPTILRLTGSEIAAAIKQKGAFSKFRDVDLRLSAEGPFSAFYAPFDWVNEDAEVVVVGITPGLHQAAIALQHAARELRKGRDLDTVARVAKQAASFEGRMRELAAQLMDHFRFHDAMGITSCADLFGKEAHRAHYTSVMRYPVLKDHAGYSGHERMLEVPFLRKQVYAHLPDELRRVPNALVVPFGPSAAAVLRQMIRDGVLQEDRLLDGLLHPSGSQMNRINYQLGHVPRERCHPMVGCDKIDAMSARLRSKVARLLGRRATA